MSYQNLSSCKYHVYCNFPTRAWSTRTTKNTPVQRHTVGRLVSIKVWSSGVIMDSEIELIWSRATAAFPYPLKPLTVTVYIQPERPTNALLPHVRIFLLWSCRETCTNQPTRETCTVGYASCQKNWGKDMTATNVMFKHSIQHCAHAMTPTITVPAHLNESIPC